MVLKPEGTKRATSEMQEAFFHQMALLQTKVQNYNSVSKQHLEVFGHAIITTGIEMKRKCKTLKATKNKFLPSESPWQRSTFLYEASDKGQDFNHDACTKLIFCCCCCSVFKNSRQSISEVCGDVHGQKSSRNPVL